MKNLVTAVALLFVANLSMAQKSYDDLQILFADENYEKLVSVAESYTQKDKYKKDVPPYIYMAKGLYAIAQSGNTDEKYKNAYKDALKALGKGFKIDMKTNDGATLEEFSEFVDEVQMSCVNRMTNDVDIDQYKKAFSLSMKYQKITSQLAGVKYFQGACKYKSADKSSARLLWKDANLLADEITSIEGWSEADVEMLKMGILEAAGTMVEGRQEENAKKLIGKAAVWFEGDKDWDERADAVMNPQPE